MFAGAAFGSAFLDACAKKMGISPVGVEPTVSATPTKQFSTEISPSGEKSSVEYEIKDQKLILEIDGTVSLQGLTWIIGGDQESVLEYLRNYGLEKGGKVIIPILPCDYDDKGCLKTGDKRPSVSGFISLVKMTRTTDKNKKEVEEVNKIINQPSPTEYVPPQPALGIETQPKKSTWDKLVLGTEIAGGTALAIGIYTAIRKIKNIFSGTQTEKEIANQEKDLPKPEEDTSHPWLDDLEPCVTSDQMKILEKYRPRERFGRLPKVFYEVLLGTHKVTMGPENFAQLVDSCIKHGKNISPNKVITYNK